MTEVYYAIESDGTVKHVTVTEREVLMDQNIMSRFAVDNPIKVNSVMSAAILPESPGLGNIGLSIKRNNIAATIRLAQLPLRCAFKMKSGAMVPDFKNGNNDPEFVMNWVPPDNMRLYFMVNMIQPAMSVDVQFLVAVDPVGKHYRLPLSNLYEDSRMCHGVYDYSGSTLIDVISKAWTQFQKSRWQSDLVDRGGASSVSNSMEMFKFKPLEPSGFEQLPIKDGYTWESLSTRISSPFITEHIVL